MKTGRIYWVKWDDAHMGEPGWKDPKEDHDVCWAESVGFLVKKTKRKIVLCQTVGEQPGIAALIAIPTGCVVVVRRLSL